MSVRAVVLPTLGTEVSNSSISCRRAAHAVVDVGLDLAELLLQQEEVAIDTLDDALVAHGPLAIALGDDHLDDLAAARRELAEALGTGLGCGRTASVK